MRLCLTSPPQARQRVTFSARRTKKGAFAGYHACRSDLVIEIDRCDLIQLELRDALPMVKVLVIAGASRKSTLSVQINTYETALDFTARGRKPLDQGLEISLAQTTKHFSSCCSAGKSILSLCAPHPFKGSGEPILCHCPAHFFRPQKKVRTAFYSTVSRSWKKRVPS